MALIILLQMLKKFIVNKLATFNDDIKMQSDEKLYWHGLTTSYITANTTDMEIKSPATLDITSSTVINANTNSMNILSSSSSNATLEVKSAYVTNGQSLINMISDNGADKGDGLQIKHVNGSTTFSMDHNVVGTYDRPLLLLKGHNTQSSRKIVAYGKLEVLDGFSVDFGSDATADMFYRNSSGDFARLPKGTAGQVLKMNSGATAPEWGDEGGSSGGISFDGSTANGDFNLQRF